LARKEVVEVHNKRHARLPALGEAKCPPTFQVRQLKSAAGWYVRVSWRYGEVEHVSGFASADEAERWIDEKSEAWLRNRTAALRRG